MSMGNGAGGKDGPPGSEDDRSMGSHAGKSPGGQDANVGTGCAGRPCGNSINNRRFASSRAQKAQGDPARRRLWLGLACAAGGTGLWGLSFVAPVFLPGISPWDISLGRYLIFGIIGLFGLRGVTTSGVRLVWRDWLTASVFAVTGYYGCYTVLVYAMNLSGPALPTLVMGLTPVTVALVGAVRSREGGLARLAWPLAAIGLGLLTVNLARHGQGLDTRNLGAGLTCSLAALGLLTHYLVANMLYLKKRPGMSPLAWANVTGCTLLVMALAALAVRLLAVRGLPWEGTPTSAWGYFAGCATLGAGASWLGGILWNKANTLLPAALVGQCIVFWPVSGVVLACVVQRSLPSLLETGGMLVVFAGVWWGVRTTAKTGSEGS